MDGDEPALIRLVKETFNEFLGGDYWIWKYKDNPDFKPSLVAVAEKDGEVVGCNHWLLRDLQLSPGLKVKSALGADIIVHPAHRGRGVGTKLLLYLRSIGAHEKERAFVSYMFADPVLASKLYGPVAGYVCMPSCTTMYEKFLNCRKLEEKIAQTNDRIRTRKLQEKLERLNTCILFRLNGAPPFAIHALGDGFRLEEGEVQHPDAVVEGDLLFFSSLMERRWGVWDLMRGLLAGKLRLKKGFWKILRLWRVFNVFNMAWNLA